MGDYNVRSNSNAKEFQQRRKKEGLKSVQKRGWNPQNLAKNTLQLQEVAQTPNKINTKKFRPR